MSRHADLVIDTHDSLVEQIQYVIDHPGIDGFECLLAREVRMRPEAKQAAYHFARLGFRVKMYVEPESCTATHEAVTVTVQRPVVVKADAE